MAKISTARFRTKHPRRLGIPPQSNSRESLSFSPCLQIIRRDFLTQTGIVFPTQRIGEDAAFSVDVALTAKVIRYLPEAHFYRRLRPQSLTTGSSSVATIRAALLSYQAIMSIHGRVVHQDAHTALDILAKRLHRFALHRFDQLPPELKGAITAFNLVEDEPSLSAKFLDSQRKGRLMRQVRRAVGVSVVLTRRRAPNPSANACPSRNPKLWRRA